MNSLLLRQNDPGANLALAVIASSGALMLMLDGDAKLLAASDSFYDIFVLDRAKAIGRLVYDLDDWLWDSPRLHSLLRATVSAGSAIDAYELDLKTGDRGVRRLVIKAQTLVHAGSGDVRILLSIADVTDARLAEKDKDDLVREKALLLQEVQHRVANSLQIIASVLMQSARSVQSREVREHLHDAHHRVMSIAAVQKQLAVTNAEHVELRPYLTQLCQSIEASMVADHSQLSLIVQIDDCIVAANISISIGLIVTELVINALKHAFPNQRHGQITVSYTARGSDWELYVTDDGVGMPTEPHPTPAGLGSSIVQALAKHLRARLKVENASPGTKVSIAHFLLSAVKEASDDAVV